MTATKKLRQHPKPPTRSALARPTGSGQWLFCAKCGEPYKTNRPFVVIGTKRHLRQLCDVCTGKLLIEMADAELGPNR
jgi:hypothetical protein